MDVVHKLVLKKHRLSLARSLDRSELVQFLVQENVINDRMVERIESGSTTFDRNVTFLNILPTRGPQAYTKFIEALKETNQEYLANALEEEEKILTQSRQNSKNTRKRRHSSQSVTTESPKPLDFHDGPNKIALDKTTMEFYRSNYHRAYKMSSRPRGYALIVNVTEFDPGVDLPQRQGGNIDKENLGSVLHHLGFETLLVENRTAAEIECTLKAFALREEHKSRDACVIALLTHGREGTIYGRDGRELAIEEIVSTFDNANCPNLRNKPKIFFVQACRGDYFDRGIDEADGGSKIRRTECQVTVDRTGFEEGRLPTRSDMVFGYATQHGQAAMRNTHHGSWYVEALVKVLARDAKNKDLTEILTKVNSVIKSKRCYSPGNQIHNCKEMPIFHSTLCKKLYFFPGIFQANS